MYSFTPTEEQQMLLDAVRRYADQDMRPAAREADEKSELPQDLIEKGWELGILQASIPEDYDGFGEYSSLTGVLAAEAMAYGDLSTALAVMTPNLFALPILFSGSEKQKKEYLPAVIAAEWKPYTAALIEPSFNFDPWELSTSAVLDGDSILISGEKTYVPYAAEAEALIIYANVDGETQGFIVPQGTEGLSVGERQKTLGIHAYPLYSVTLDKVKIPAGNRLNGSEGHSPKSIMASCQVALAAMAVGVAQAAFDYAVDYAKEREVFGVKVAQKQAIAFMIAEMGTDIEATRLLAWEAAWMLDEGKDEADKHAYLAYNGAVDMVMMVTDAAVQILGGHGYIREHPVEMWMRNGRGFAAFTGLALV
ncbi:MAG: acyl-CoA dehydrogenase [Anaerolineales bacterium]|nr:acyl-CoA dehydrogenase [Anaerolineales bacterium]